MATGSLKAQIEITADASGVDAGVSKAKRSLADLGATAAKAGKDAAAGIGGIGTEGTDAAVRVDRATQRMITAVQRTTVALESGGRSSAKFFDTISQQRGLNADALRPYIQALSEVEAKQKAAAAALATSTAPIAQFGMSARATAAALRTVPAQVTDVVTALQAGQAPLTVLLQQGGQLKDVFGGVGPAARALGGYIVGLINPITLAAAAAATLGFAFVQGRKESEEYAKALILTGNAAGTTAGKLQASALAVSQTVGTQGKAAETLTALAATGRVAAADLERLTVAAVRFERDAGQGVAETAKQFAELGREPVAAAIKLNETTHFLTLSLYQQIKALDETGRTADAAALAQRGYADALVSRSGQLETRLGVIERGWIAVKDAAKGAWDSMLNVGRPDTLQSQLAKAQAALATATTSSVGSASVGDRSSFEKDNQALRDRIAVLQESIRFEDRAADAQRRAAAQVEARIKFDKDGVQFLTKEVKAEREIAAARAEGAAAGASQVEIEKRIADIREKFADKKGAGIALRVDKAQLALDLATLRAASEQLLAGFANDERVIEAQRAAGLTSESDYFQKKRELIVIDAELRDYAASREIAALEAAKRAGADKLDNDRKIAEAEGKRAIARAQASAALETLSIAEVAAAKRLAGALLEARQAAQDYLADLEKAQSRDLGGIGQGNQARARRAGVDQIDDRFEQQRRELENVKARQQLEGTFTDTQRQQYDERLRTINEFQAKAIASFSGYYDALMDKQRDWSLGAQEALKNYSDRVGNTFESVRDLVDHSFKGMEDSLVAFITTGKGGFHSLVDSIVADIVRITVQQQLLKPLASYLGGDSGSSAGTFIGLLGSLFGGSSSPNAAGGFATVAGISGGRAAGGAVHAGGLYRINENGPGEILSQGGSQYLMAGADGMVKSAGGGWGKTTNVSQTFVLQQPANKQTQGQLAAAAAAGLRRGERDS